MIIGEMLELLRVYGIVPHLTQVKLSEDSEELALDVIVSSLWNAENQPGRTSATPFILDRIPLPANLAKVHLEVDGIFGLESKPRKGSASDFVASGNMAFSGFGLANHCPFFDPTDVEEDTRSTKLWSHFHKSSETIEAELFETTVEMTAQQVADSILVNNDLSKISNTKEIYSLIGKDRLVQSEHMAGFKRCFEGMLHTDSDTLASVNCGFGIVSGASKPGGRLDDSNGNVRAIIEVKHNTDTPAESLRQGAAEGSNVALAQLALGVGIDDIVVPIIGSNGYLIQFGAVILLKPSFPAFFIISHVLDLTHEESLVEAARLLCCIKIMVSKSLPLKYANGTIEEMNLSLASYHCKPLSDFFLYTGNYQTSLFRHFKIMKQLHRNNGCRNYLVFPICVREFLDNPQNTMLVYPKLDSDYKMGLPEESELRIAFIKELKNCITSFHDAGIVHMDLFPSNILWRKVSQDKVQLKVVDWDSAVFVDETISDLVEDRLYGRRRKLIEKVQGFGKTHEIEQNRLYDISLLMVLETFNEDPSLRSNDKRQLDKAFISLQLKFLKE